MPWAAAFLALILALPGLPGVAHAQVARPPPNDGAAWAAAYAGISANLCGVYTVDSQALLETGGLYWPEAPGWADDGSALLAFRAGGHAAERAAHGDPTFCLDPAAYAGDHASFVRRFLVLRRPLPG